MIIYVEIHTEGYGAANGKIIFTQDFEDFLLKGTENQRIEFIKKMNSILTDADCVTRNSSWRERIEIL